MSATDLRILMVTASAQQAPELLRALIHERLVACGNILTEVRSIYRWRGEICDESEAMMFLETVEDRLDAARQRIEELHTYDVPKIVVLEPSAANAAYLEWVRQQTQRAPP